MIVVGGYSKEVSVISENYCFVLDGSFQLFLIRHSQSAEVFSREGSHASSFQAFGDGNVNTFINIDG